MKQLLVPRTRFELAHPCERCHLKAVRLPISPSGRVNTFNGLWVEKFNGFQKPLNVLNDLNH